MEVGRKYTFLEGGRNCIFVCCGVFTSPEKIQYGWMDLHGVISTYRADLFKEYMEPIQIGETYTSKTKLLDAVPVFANNDVVLCCHNNKTYSIFNGEAFRKHYHLKEKSDA